MESLIVPQPILDVHGDGSKGAVVQVVIIPIEEELVVPEALTEIQGQPSPVAQLSFVSAQA